MVRGTKEKAKLTGRKKAAILMITLGPDIASDVYRCLTDEEIEQITLEVANIGTVPQELTAQVIEEFYHTAMAKQYITHGGISTAREILEKALGPGKAMEIIERLQGMLQGTPFDFLKKVDPNHLLNFIQSEHPQNRSLNPGSPGIRSGRCHHVCLASGNADGSCSPYCHHGSNLAGNHIRSRACPRT